MSVNVPLIGNVKPVALDLTTTNATTLYTPPSASIKGFVESIKICDDSGSGSSITIVLNDGTSDFTMYNSLAVAANATEVLADFNTVIPYGWTLKVTATDANRLLVVANVVEMIPQQRGSGSF